MTDTERLLQSRQRRALRLHGDHMEQLLSTLESMVSGALGAGIGS